MFSQMQSALAKRAMDYTVDVAKNPEDSGPIRQLQSWEWIVLLTNMIVIIPILILSNYTIEKALPILAIVEDENPPAYEPVAIDDPEIATASIPGIPKPAGVRKPASAAEPTRSLDLGEDTTPITRSFRASWRLWKSYGGFRSIFRGFACYLFHETVLSSVVGASAGNLIAGPILSYISTLLLVQFSTAWVHIVMTPPSKLHFWRRLPAFKRTLAATWRPVSLAWLATRGTNHIFTAFVSKYYKPDHAQFTWFIVIIPAFLLIHWVLAVLAYVILIRVQASLLPDEEETIIPFDRSFRGKVEPTVVGGTGYVSIRDALSTFSRAAWIRYIKFSVKTAFVGTAIFLFMFVFMTPSIFVISSGDKNSPENGPQ